MNPKTRDKLLAWLSENPNSSREEMAAAIGMTTATVGNITRTLEACQVIHLSGSRAHARLSGRRIGLYSMGKSEARTQKISNTERKIYDQIKLKERADAMQIAKATGKTRASVYRHLAHLMALDMIYIADYGKPVEPGNRRPAIYKIGQQASLPYPVKPKVKSKPKPKPKPEPKPKPIKLPCNRRVAKTLIHQAPSPFGVLMAQL